MSYHRANMKRFLPFLALAAFALGACSSVPNNKINYTAPSTGRVQSSVASAQTNADKTSATLTAAAAKAKTATEKIKVIEKAVENNPPVLTLAQDLHSDIDTLTQLLLDGTATNNELKADLGAAVVAIADLQIKVGEQTQLLNEANIRTNAALTQGKIDRDNAHKFKAILIGLGTLAALAIMFGFLGVKMFVPPLLWATLAVPSAVGVFLFFWLGSG